MTKGRRISCHHDRRGELGPKGLWYVEAKRGLEVVKRSEGLTKAAAKMLLMKAVHGRR